MFGNLQLNRKLKAASDHLDRGRLDEAADIILPLREEKPKDATLMLYAAVIAFERKDFDESKKLIQAAMEIQEDNPVLHLVLGEVYYATQDYESSVKELQTVLELSPGHPKAEYLLGLNCLAQEKIDEATLHFEAVAREDRDFLLARLLTVGESLLRKSTTKTPPV